MDLESLVQYTGFSLDDIDLNMDDDVVESYAAVLGQQNIKTEQN